MKSLLICGGVGGAKLAKGFYRSEQNFDLLVNVGDDFNHFGLHISPDLDTVMYTLSDQVNQKQGWEELSLQKAFTVQTKILIY